MEQKIITFIIGVFCLQPLVAQNVNVISLSGYIVEEYDKAEVEAFYGSKLAFKDNALQMPVDIRRRVSFVPDSVSIFTIPKEPCEFFIPTYYDDRINSLIERDKIKDLSIVMRAALSFSPYKVSEKDGVLFKKIRIKGSFLVLNEGVIDKTTFKSMKSDWTLFPSRVKSILVLVSIYNYDPYNGIGDGEIWLPYNQ